MFSINCKLLMQILCEIRRSLQLRNSGYHPVTVTIDRKATTIRVITSEASIACQIPIGGKPATITLPMRTLTALKCASKRDITFSLSDTNVSLSRWHDGREVTETVECLSPVLDSPQDSEWRLSNPRQLGKTLRQAANITDSESTRYSLGCLQLRGRDGQIAATDGRQAFTQAGFNFPVDQVLVPAAPLKQLACLERCSSMSIGRSAHWISLRMTVGPLRWLVDLKIFTDGRFPNIDQCMPYEDTARCTLTIGDRDAAYLQQHLGRLIVKSTEIQPLTIDLSKDRASGQQTVQLRFTSQAELADILTSESSQFHQSDDGGRKSVEISLDSSYYDNLPMRVALDYRYLLQALHLGFREFCFSSETNPIFCIDNQRRYVCAVLHPSSVKHATPNALVISTTRQVAAA